MTGGALPPPAKASGFRAYLMMEMKSINQNIFYNHYT